MKISLVVAIAENGVIGRDGDLAVRIPADLRRFKQITFGHPLIMGRKTFQSIGRPLPGRHNIVISRDEAFKAEGVTAVHSLGQAFDAARPAGEVMVIGGAEIYRQTLADAARLYLTEVHARIPGDVFFPAFDRTEWRETFREDHAAEGDAPAFSFVNLERVRQTPGRR